MAGTYTEGQSKVLSGVYTLIKAALERVQLGSRGIVAIPFTSDWGPVNSLETIIMQPEFDKAYNGSGTSLTANKVYSHLFKGKPSRVLAYRMATASAAKGTASVPAGASSWELETAYPSDRAFNVVVKDGVNAGEKVVEITEGGVLLASVKASEVDSLETALNGTGYVKVTSKGTALPDNTAGVAFAGGDNGSAVTSTEYQNFLTEVEADGTANTTSLDGTSDAAIKDLAEAWVKRVRDEGVYTTLVVGGPAAWDNDPAAANTASKALNHRGIINVGNGLDGFTAAEIAIYVAARAASVALNRTLTDALAGGYDNVNKQLTPGQRVKAKEEGTLVFVKKGGVVIIDEGINTLTVPPAGETVEMRKIRVHNTLDQISRDLEAFGDEYKKDKSNTAEARQTYAATVEQSYLQGLAAMEVIKADYFYEPDPEYHGKDASFKPAIDEAFFHSEVWPVDSMERIYQKIGVKF